MWSYEKRLQYPVNISNPNPKLAQLIISQFGGPNGRRRLQFSPYGVILLTVRYNVGGLR